MKILAECRTIGLNICRDQQSGHTEGSSWSPLSAFYHYPSRVGRVEFSPMKEPTVEDEPEVVRAPKGPLSIHLKLDWKLSDSIRAGSR